jgi:cyclopropane fatty-acyl-phospholipid synthase-like methyltransferase
MPESTLTKHDTLTEDEMRNFSMSPRIFRHIEYFRDKMNLKSGDMNVLDWGCGRGRSVVWLRGQGYNAFGADIDP